MNIMYFFIAQTKCAHLALITIKTYHHLIFYYLFFKFIHIKLLNLIWVFLDYKIFKKRIQILFYLYHTYNFQQIFFITHISYQQKYQSIYFKSPLIQTNDWTTAQKLPINCLTLYAYTPTECEVNSYKNGSGLILFLMNAKADTQINDQQQKRKESGVVSGGNCNSLCLTLQLAILGFFSPVFLASFLLIHAEVRLLFRENSTLILRFPYLLRSLLSLCSVIANRSTHLS